MTAIPERQNATVPAMYEWRVRQAALEPPRPHLGASIVGHSCKRRIWGAFRWLFRETSDGKLLRIFNTGKREEERVFEELRGIGCEVSTGPEPGTQWTFSAIDGHFGGSMDAAVRGLPEAPKRWHCLEIKTHNDKSYKALVKEGVRAWKPMHWVQMQLYLRHFELERAAYIAINKNDDSIYLERVEYDSGKAEEFVARAEDIVYSEDAPLKLSDDPEHWECKMCPMHAQCHGTEAPVPSCRSCSHSTPVANGKWHCEWWNSDIPLDAQAKGCKDHRYIPALLSSFAELVDYNSVSNVAVWRNKLTDVQFSQPRYTSLELYQATDKRALGQMFVEAVKDEFGISARVGWKDFPDDLPWATDAKQKDGIAHEQLGELYRT